MKLESDSSELIVDLDSLGTGIHWLIVSFFLLRISLSWSFKVIAVRGHQVV